MLVLGGHRPHAPPGRRAGPGGAGRHLPRGDVELVPEMAKFASSDSRRGQGGRQAGDVPGPLARARPPSPAAMRRPNSRPRSPARLRSVQGKVGLRPRCGPPGGERAGPAAALPGSQRRRQDGAGGDGRTGRRPTRWPNRAQCGGRRRCWWAWSPPGRSRSPPATAPFLKGTATAQVEVLPAAEPGELRIVPSTALAGPGANDLLRRPAATARLGAVEGSPPGRRELDRAAGRRLDAGQRVAAARL